MIDQACKRHINKNRGWLKYVKDEAGWIETRNNGKILAEGMGRIQVISIVHGKKIFMWIENVLYASKMIYDLISRNQPRRIGYRTEIDVDARNA